MASSHSELVFISDSTDEAQTGMDLSDKERERLRLQLQHVQDAAVEAILSEPLDAMADDPPEFSERMQTAIDHLSRVETSKVVGVDTTAGTSKKKRKDSSKKKKTKGLKPEATGFEAFYADAPQTPEEAKVEAQIYSLDKSITMRMESCIQRYRAARKLETQPWRRSVFDAYLIFGGVSTGPKEFGSAGVVGSMATELHQQMAAVDFVDEVQEDQEVDFVYLVQAFCSSKCLAAAGQSSAQRVWEAPSVIINFLKYVNFHKVLPEYANQISAAIRFLQVAQEELYAAKLFSLDVPGNFNTALSVVFGGYYHDLSHKQLDWISHDKVELEKLIDEVKAHDILSSHLSSTTLRELQSTSVQRTEHGFPVEVVGIETMTDELSTLFLKPWCDIPGAAIEDKIDTDLCEINVLVEKDIAARVFPKMHFEATFYQMQDFWFFDTVTRVLPSFYIETGDGYDESRD